MADGGPAGESQGFTGAEGAEQLIGQASTVDGDNLIMTFPGGGQIVIAGLGSLTDLTSIPPTVSAARPSPKVPIVNVPVSVSFGLSGLLPSAKAASSTSPSPAEATGVAGRGQLHLYDHGCRRRHRYGDGFGEHRDGFDPAVVLDRRDGR